MSNTPELATILLKKKDLAAWIPCSIRQVELMVKAGKLPQPFYIGDASPRWRQSDIESWIDRLAKEAQSREEVAQ
jgi:predicted DNA-binding transcriptional regulator AlpA